VSESLEPDPGPDQQGRTTVVGDAEETRAVALLTDEMQVVRAQPMPGALPDRRRSAGAVIPAAQAAAVAAGGFVAGAAVVGLMHRRQRRSSALTKGRRARQRLNRTRPSGARKAGGVLELVQIVGSRSLLVDVHLLGSSGDR
jgi:hypothetical protein